MAMCASTTEWKAFSAYSLPIENLLFGTAAPTRPLTVPREGLNKRLSVVNGATTDTEFSQATVDLERPAIRAITRIRQLGTYEDGWYLSDSLAPQPQAVKDAVAFIWSMDFDALEYPFIGLAEDGEINFLWENEYIELDLGFYGKDGYSYYAKLADGREILKDEVPADQSLPEEILACLRKR